MDLLRTTSILILVLTNAFMGGFLMFLLTTIIILRAKLEKNPVAALAFQAVAIFLGVVSPVFWIPTKWLLPITGIETVLNIVLIYIKL